MKKVDSMSSGATVARPAWQSPKLQELGNIRRFVQVGNANGKSGNLMDGGSDCGGEAMQDGGNCDTM